MEKRVTLRAQSKDVDGLRRVLAEVQGTRPSDVLNGEVGVAPGAGHSQSGGLRSFEVEFTVGEKEGARRTLAALYDQSGKSGSAFHITLSDMIRFDTGEESLDSALKQLDVVWKAICE